MLKPTAVCFPSGTYIDIVGPVLPVQFYLKTECLLPLIREGWHSHEEVLGTLPGLCQAGSWCLSKGTMSLPLPREWLSGKSLEQQARAMEWVLGPQHLLDRPRSGEKVSGISNNFATGKLVWDVNHCNGTTGQFRILKHFPFLTVGIWGSCEKYVLESIPLPISMRDENLQQPWNRT